MRARYEITPPAARLAVLLFQVNDAGGTLKGHGEAQHAVLMVNSLVSLSEAYGAWLSFAWSTCEM